MSHSRAARDSTGNGVAHAVDSSTVVLLRQMAGSPAGTEVLLLQRHRASRTFAGAHVFPGGKVEDGDRRLDPVSWKCRDLDGRREEITARSQEDALGFLVAAVRESFEEAGVLLARRRDGSPLTVDDVQGPAFVSARERLASRHDMWDWASWLRQHQIVLDLDALVMWSWWVTPVHRPYRFDTRFFLAALPAHQAACHDAVETISMRWTNPTGAIRDHEDGRIELRAATLANLEQLRPYATADEAMAAARRGDVNRCRIQPD